MRALVTGGAGFIGSNLVDALVEAGDDVVVLDDLSTGFAANLHPAATLVEGEVSDPAAVARAVAGCEVVFHQAAHRAVLRSVEQPLDTDRANDAGASPGSSRVTERPRTTAAAARPSNRK